MVFPPPGSKTQERDAETPMRQTVVRYESPSMLKLEWRVLIFFFSPPNVFLKSSPASRLRFTYFLSPQNLLWFTSKTIVRFFKMRVVTFWATCVTGSRTRRRSVRKSDTIWTRAKRRLAEVETTASLKMSNFLWFGKRETSPLLSHFPRSLTLLSHFQPS